VSTTPAPSYDQVTGLPVLVEATVDPSFIDLNGHMNVRHYLDHGAHGADALIRDAGIDDDYRAERRLGVFTAEHHIRYFSEMHEGDKFTVHALLMERSTRAAHLIAFVVDRVDEAVACTVEIMLVHVGLDTRRPEPFPADVATRLDEWIARSDVQWPVPVCGAIGIRR
jgi:acyl-CoA thioester hydrolase